MNQSNFKLHPNFIDIKLLNDFPRPYKTQNLGSPPTLLARNSFEGLCNCYLVRPKTIEWSIYWPSNCENSGRNSQMRTAANRNFYHYYYYYKLQLAIKIEKCTKPNSQKKIELKLPTQNKMKYIITKGKINQPVDIESWTRQWWSYPILQPKSASSRHVIVQESHSNIPGFHLFYFSFTFLYYRNLLAITTIKDTNH